MRKKLTTLALYLNVVTLTTQTTIATVPHRNTNNRLQRELLYPILQKNFKILLFFRALMKNKLSKLNPLNDTSE
jgi:uncharacterized membrane protein